MNAIFNFSRFEHYLKRNLLGSKSQLLLLLAIIAGSYILGMLIFWLVGWSLQPLLVFLTIAILVGGPCFLESNITRYNSVMEFTFPVSTFERFLFLWIKYVILLPVSVFIIFFFLSFPLSYSGITPLVQYADYFLQNNLTWNHAYAVWAVQSVLLAGFLSFKRLALLKTIAIVLGLLIFYFLLVKLMVDNRMISGQMVGESISDTLKKEEITAKIYLIKDIGHYICYILFPVGLWIVGFFKLKEKEI